MRALIAMLLALWTLPALAYDDPKALVDAIYAPYTTLGTARAQDPAQYYSERLKGLIARNAAPSANDDSAPPVLDFNPFIGAQQALLRDLAISAPIERDGKALVTVSFTNFDNTALLSLSLVREADGWKVDDVASLGEGENWLLSWLLQYDPFAIR
ncbi:MAG: DUF3828 domain-containing protein [Devosia sp.]|uniref:DUF3828 domain-containing protein n=1 Tax=Devosia sp. TaxID=1871048 RepID=UPI001A63C27E|nr:DUF3828 domain-containing protein [Devosia sp.]MBL8597681.1 DUF3828 domain-containing protein [Devosia sp.]